MMYRMVELSNRTWPLASVLLTRTLSEGEEDLDLEGEMGRRKIPPVWESVSNE
jgi:hypothetical protein